MRKPGSSGAETLRNLRAAAIQLMSEHGYGAMNLRMLARKVGVQASSLYNYIDSKQQLLFLLCEETTENLLTEFDRTVNASEDPVERLRNFVAFHLSYHIVNRKQASVLQMEIRSLTAKNYQAITRLQREYTDKVRAIVEAGAAAGAFKVRDAEIATFALVQMLTAVTRWYRPQGRLSLEDLVAIYTDLSLGMMQTEVRVESAATVRGSAGTAGGNRRERRAEALLEADPVD